MGYDLQQPFGLSSPEFGHLLITLWAFIWFGLWDATFAAAANEWRGNVRLKYMHLPIAIIFSEGIYNNNSTTATGLPSAWGGYMMIPSGLWIIDAIMIVNCVDHIMTYHEGSMIPLMYCYSFLFRNSKVVPLYKCFIWLIFHVTTPHQREWIEKATFQRPWLPRWQRIILDIPWILLLGSIVYWNAIGIGTAVTLQCLCTRWLKSRRNAHLHKAFMMTYGHRFIQSNDSNNTLGAATAITSPIAAAATTTTGVATAVVPPPPPLPISIDISQHIVSTIIATSTSLLHPLSVIIASYIANRPNGQPIDLLTDHVAERLICDLWLQQTDPSGTRKTLQRHHHNDPDSQKYNKWFTIPSRLRFGSHLASTNLGGAVGYDGRLLVRFPVRYQESITSSSKSVWSSTPQTSSSLMYYLDTNGLCHHRAMTLRRNWYDLIIRMDQWLRVNPFNGDVDTIINSLTDSHTQVTDEQLSHMVSTYGVPTTRPQSEIWHDFSYYNNVNRRVSLVCSISWDQWYPYSRHQPNHHINGGHTHNSHHNNDHHHNIYECNTNSSGINGMRPTLHPLLTEDWISPTCADCIMRTPHIVDTHSPSSGSSSSSSPNWSGSDSKRSSSH
jgi:hypothetical protein